MQLAHNIDSACPGICHYDAPTASGGVVRIHDRYCCWDWQCETGRVPTDSTPMATSYGRTGTAAQDHRAERNGVDAPSGWNYEGIGNV